MNRPTSSKFVSGLPDDDEISTPTNSKDINSLKFYDGVADCSMNDADTIKNVKIRAKDLAQDNLIKKIADYVDAFLRDRLLTFPHDEILAIANEIYHVTDVKYDVFNSDDDKMMIRATVFAKVDDNDIMNCLVRFFKERIELKLQIEDLKRQIKELKSQHTNNQQNTSQVVSKDKIALSKQKLVEGWKLHGKKDYTGAIRLYDEAISLNPNNADAYHNRGVAFRALGYAGNANEDFAKAKELGW